ncbi:Inosine/uridine-preferring nucleoside hydrolase domain-containing protein [Lineolata rhizophorae]|uniref:Inosine/uridine-preferring nucleoside hydrolase domain-containing protein n=1 Tax=Lineolata rhizophorae TaxID=578093 RepID=A0A6A6PA98_9PEZI|nr:Inosine/uridine-preferring nucleoside hydrolase domain-containing protein [Lineolata rhizophorae]
MAPNRIIIDTDPGIDDVMAMLLALSAAPEELEVLMISVTWGNVEVQNCLRNVMSLFHHIAKEQEWRRANGQPEGFETLKKCKPIVAVGADRPLEDQRMMADYFHGVDGLAGIYTSHPHLTPAETWANLFASALSSNNPDLVAAAREAASSSSSTAANAPTSHALFTPTNQPAHEAILSQLRAHPADTITLVAVGPLTNLALAAAADPHAFLRAKQVVVMGGAVDEVGNITPVAEFNTFADAVAAARVYALTSPRPASTMPPAPPPAPAAKTDGHEPPSRSSQCLPPYPKGLGSRRLKVVLFSLDITTPHEITRGMFLSTVKPLVSAGSPLAEWVSAFVTPTFAKMEALHVGAADRSPDDVGLALHDPLCIWYALLHEKHPEQWKMAAGAPEDIRVETAGQWTRGMCVVDRRDRKRREEPTVEARAEVEEGDEKEEEPEVHNDTGNWLGSKGGNRIWRVVGTPGHNVWGPYLLKRIFQLS